MKKHICILILTLFPLVVSAQWKIAGDYIKTKFVDDNEFISFIDMIKNRSIHKFNLDVSSGDKILTLSSCYSKTERLVVHAKLINSQAR